MLKQGQNKKESISLDEMETLIDSKLEKFLKELAEANKKVAEAQRQLSEVAESIDIST